MHSFDILTSTNVPKRLAALSECHVLNYIPSSKVYAPGQARNYAITYSLSELIFIVDADLICTPTLTEQFQGNDSNLLIVFYV
ncbi:glycosyltransferase, partial [Escherichia coli]|uniref:glycosyltransferase n=1 Tax=Escherichia coli TaxID=562 RepID=UPI0011E90836